MMLMLIEKCMWEKQTFLWVKQASSPQELEFLGALKSYLAQYKSAQRYQLCAKNECDNVYFCTSVGIAVGCHLTW